MRELLFLLNTVLEKLNISVKILKDEFYKDIFKIIVQNL